VGQPCHSNWPCHAKILNRLFIFPFDFQDNPINNAAASIVVGRKCKLMIKWKPAFETGVPKIDRQHRVLFTSLNRLEELLASGNVDQVEANCLLGSGLL
jgi:hypothetical protein